jgi:hypothetical protein
MNGHWSNDTTFLIIRYDDQTMSMPSNRDHAPRDGIEVSFRRESQYLLNDGQIKPS